MVTSSPSHPSTSIFHHPDPTSTSTSPPSSSSSPPHHHHLKTAKSVRFAAEVGPIPVSRTASSSASTTVDRSDHTTLFSIDDHHIDIDIDIEDPQGKQVVARGYTATTPFEGDIGGASARQAYGLKSTLGSREAEFDAASDTFSDDDAQALEGLQQEQQRSRRDTDDAGHLLSPNSRRAERSLGPLPLPSGIRHSMDSFGGNISELRRNVLEGLEGVGNATGLHLTRENGELPDWLKRGAGVFDATTNMANSILGAGIVGLPYSMKQSGFVAGVVLLVGLAMLTDWTIRLIILNSKLSGRQTYIEIMEHCFGRSGKAAVSLFQLAFAYGGMCAFCVVIGDTIPHVLSSIFPSLAPGASAFSFLASRTFVISACTLLISYPLSLYRDIENLSKASAVALVSMVLIVGTVMLRGPAMPAELKGDPSLRFTIVNPSNLVSSISVISFAFVCHHNSLLIYASLKEPSMDKFSKVTHYSTAIACAALTAMSIAGYWTFEEKTLGNILNNFPEGDVMVNIARLAFGINMFTTFPLEAFVCREVLETYFFNSQYTPRRHLILTSSLVFSSLIVSLLTCDLGVVLELTGGLSATALAFIFPAICFLKLAKEGEGKALKLGVGRRARRRAVGGSGGAAAAAAISNTGGSRSGVGVGGPRSSARYQPLSTGDGDGMTTGSQDDQGEDEARDTLADLEDAQGPRRHTRTSSTLSIDDDGEEEDEEEEEEEEEISINDLELPLRPGASIRTRRTSVTSPASASNGPLHSGTGGGTGGGGTGPFTSLSTCLDAETWTDREYWYEIYSWWTSTKPLAVLCAAFGTLVLAISVVQAFWKLFTGEGRADGAGGSC